MIVAIQLNDIAHLLKDLWHYLSSAGGWTLFLISSLVNIFLIYIIASKKHRMRLEEVNIKLKIFEGKFKSYESDDIEMLHKELKLLKNQVRKVKKEKYSIILSIMIFMIVGGILRTIQGGLSILAQKTKEEEEARKNDKKQFKNIIESVDQLMDEMPDETFDLLDKKIEESQKSKK